jgi:hypothetical protein
VVDNETKINVKSLTIVIAPTATATPEGETSEQLPARITKTAAAA